MLSFWEFWLHLGNTLLLIPLRCKQKPRKPRKNIYSIKYFVERLCSGIFIVIQFFCIIDEIDRLKGILMVKYYEGPKTISKQLIFGIRPFAMGPSIPSIASSIEHLFVLYHSVLICLISCTRGIALLLDYSNFWCRVKGTLVTANQSLEMT